MKTLYINIYRSGERHILVWQRRRRLRIFFSYPGHSREKFPPPSSFPLRGIVGQAVPVVEQTNDAIRIN